MVKKISNEDFVSGVLKLESSNFKEISERLNHEDITRLLHAATGLCTESGELLDALKKHIFYGSPLDKANLLEEAGDIQWYLVILLDVLKKSLGEMFYVNQKKLEKRYGNKFSKEKAINRNLSEERKILEDGII